jgi:hypothetical protein
MANTISNNRISNLINSQLPFFVRNDHANFVLFLEKYYEYLEQNDKVLNRIKNIQNFQDIDLTEDEFAEKLYSTFMILLPDDIVADKKLLVKHIKDFYRAKGTEKSVKFLFNIIYNTSDISFYYPKKDILRASDGKWYIQKSVRIIDTKLGGSSNTSLSALDKFIGTQIRGNTSGTLALVEKVDRFYERGIRIDELIISNVDGQFENGESIFTVFNDVQSLNTLSANIYSGILNTITIISGGTGYKIGDHVLIVSNTGTGACATVAQVSTGNVASIGVLYGGAGYRVGDYILASGGGGSGTNGYVNIVSTNGTIHPNSYNIVSDTISLEQNTPLNNTIYSNLNSSDINTTLEDAFDFWQYSNTGPIVSILISSSGSNYISPPDIDVIPNTAIQALGILGRMDINDGGLNYQIGDKIEFINVIGGYGTGASGNVKNVDGFGTITEVEFEQVSGHIIGGSGFDINYLPEVNVVSGTGNGANITVTSTLGSGAELLTVSSTIGAIERIVILDRGIGYSTPPTLDLTGYGDGTANAVATIVEGVYSYPGRYLNDDGHISSYNFLEDRDYYQIFSYVIRSKIPISKYRNVLKGLTHPVGTKLFGQYIIVDDITSNMVCGCEPTNIINYKTQLTNYNKTGNTINVFSSSHNIEPTMNVTLEFISGGYDNVKNGIYYVEDAGLNYFTVKMKSKLSNITILDGGSGYSSNGFLIIAGDGKGANARYTINTNGSIVGVEILEPGISYTYEPLISISEGSATFTSNITYSNDTSGQVYAPVTFAYKEYTSDDTDTTSDSTYVSSDVT